jgi:hypothetical protein
MQKAHVTQTDFGIGWGIGCGTWAAADKKKPA